MIFERARTFLLIVPIVSFFAHDALGQVVPGLSGGRAEIPNPGSPLPAVTPPSQPTIVPTYRPEAPAPAAEEPASMIAVADVHVDGVTVYAPDALDQTFGALKGTSVAANAIRNAVNALQYKYREDGYFLTKVAYRMEATPQGTVLRIVVTEGYISSVKISGDVGPVATLAYDYLKNLEQFRPLRITDLERYVLLVQSLPGMSIRTVLRPGADDPGSVELVAELERKGFDAFFSDDNRGPITTGPNELLVGAAVNSVTSLGERSQVLIYNTPFNNEELFFQGSFDGFIGDEGLKYKTYLGYGILEPGDILRTAQYKSRILLTGVGLSYPVVLSRALSIYLDGNFDISNSIIDLNDFTPDADHRSSKSDLRIFRAGVHADLQDMLFGPSLSAADYFEFKVHQGWPGLLGGTENGSKRPGRPDQKDDFTKLTGEVRRTQSLLSWDNTNLKLLVAASGQWTDDILPPTEKFFIGGTQYGRGFYYGEITGDKAVAGTTELQLNDPMDIALFGESAHLNLQYYTFYDIGQPFNLAPGDVNGRVESVGLGLRTNVTNNISIQLEGVERYTRRPTGTNTSLEPAQAFFFRISGQF